MLGKPYQSARSHRIGIRVPSEIRLQGYKGYTMQSGPGAEERLHSASATSTSSIESGHSMRGSRERSGLSSIAILVFMKLDLTAILRQKDSARSIYLHCR